MRYLDRTGQARIQESVVKIEHGKKTGTGFFVLPHVIASCYHVIDKVVTGETKVFSQGKQLTVKEISYPKSPEDVDLVTITVAEEGPKPLPLARFGQLNTSVYAYGYQYEERGYAGYGVWGELGGTVYEDLKGEQRPLILILRANIQPGLSGGPLYSVAEGCVVGIVKRQNSDGGGYATPIEFLDEVMPDVLRQNQETVRTVSSGRELLSDYFDEVAAEHEFIAMVDLHRELKLKEIYVSLTFAADTTTGRKLNLDATGRIKAIVGEDVYQLDARRDQGTPLRYFMERPVLLQELLPQGKVIILGEPGSGKTTLLRHLIARSCAGELFANKIPAFIKLVDLSNQPGAIKHYLKTTYESLFSNFETAINDGDMVLFLDGLDEVFKDRQQFLQREINRLAAKHNQVFITCRTAAFPTGLFTSDYRVYECVGFNAVQQSKFLKVWFAKSPDKAVVLERQLSQNQGTYGFSRNPLLLSLLAVVVENDPDFKLPNKRAAIYDRAIDLLFELRRGVSEDLDLSKRQVINVLQQLAHQMFLAGKETFTGDDVLNAIEQYQSESKAEGIRKYSSELIAKVIVEKIGIITKHAEGRYRFLHLTFQEYLTAKHLALTEQMAVTVAANVLDARWEEVLRLIAGVLPAAESEKILRLIWDEGERDTWLHDRLFLAGRCAGDASHVSAAYAGALSRELYKIAFQSDLETHVDSAVASLAHICGANPACLEMVMKGFYELWAASPDISVLVRYIRVLQFITNRQALKELTKLFRAFEQAGENETRIQLMGRLINAICRAGHGEMRQEIAAMIRGDNTYLSAAAAQGLTVMPTDYAKMDSLMGGSDLAVENVLCAAFVLFRSQDTEVSKQLLAKAFNQNGGFMLRSLANQCLEIETLDINEAFVLNLFHSCRSHHEEAQLLLLPGLFIFVNDRDFIRTLIFDRDAPPESRCAALSLFMNLQPNLVDEIVERLFEQEESQELLRFAIANLTQLGITSGMQYLRGKVDTSSAPPLLKSLLRMHVRLPAKDAEEWLLRAARGTSDSGTRLLALLALATAGSAQTIPCMQEIGGSGESGDVQALVVNYKVLAALQSPDAMHLLLEALWNEDNILLINHILEALGKFNEPEAEEALILCLDPERWPKQWPDPGPPLRRGEQRPSDRRRLTAILGLDHMSSQRSLPELGRIMIDDRESTEIRDVAATAIHGIAWNNRKLILSDFVEDGQRPS